MMKLRLTALEHPTPENVDINDRNTFASTILWLEDQKIRHYKIEDRAGLRSIDNLTQWEKAYAKYKHDIGIPKFKTPAEEMNWFLSYAVRLEYLDAPEHYQDITSEKIRKDMNKSNVPIVKAKNLFDNMDFQNKDFINGVRQLANKLGIAYHPDHLIQLEAVKRIVHERLSKNATKRPIIDGKPFPFEKGQDILCDDNQLDYPARILRLLQIRSLRQLQTKINETIVVVQDITADPKTDTKLGKVGY